MTIWVGELAALVAAMVWAVTSVVYGILGQKLSPLWLNLSKGVVAIAFILITFVVTASPIPPIEGIAWIMLFISGIIGIGLGDTAFFTTISYLGASRALLMETLAPLFAAFLALVFLGEILSLQAWFGIGLTLVGVAWVITEGSSGTVVTSAQPLKGVGWGILSAVGQGAGAVLSRFALVDSSISPLWSTLIRLVGGLVCIVILLAVGQSRFSSQFSVQKPPIWSRRLVGAVILTAFGSTFLGLWLQQTSLKFSPVGISQTLISTSPLFVIPIARVMGEKISLRSLLGVLISITGVAILMLSRT